MADLTVEQMKAFLAKDSQKTPEAVMDPRLKGFEYPQCSITMFRDMTRMVDATEQKPEDITRAVPQLTDEKVDFNCDKGSSNREWAAALIAAAQVAREHAEAGHPIQLDKLNNVELDEIVKRGGEIYKAFKLREEKLLKMKGKEQESCHVK